MPAYPGFLEKSPLNGCSNSSSSESYNLLGILTQFIRDIRFIITCCVAFVISIQKMVTILHFLDNIVEIFSVEKILNRLTEINYCT